MAKYRLLPWRTRLLATLTAPGHYLPHAPGPVLKAIQQAGVHPVIDRLLLGKREHLPRVSQQQVPCAHGDVPVRCYYPSLERELPVILFCHAGGWVIGNLATHDTLCRRIARQTGCLVVAVDYALAPWVKFPVPVRQAEAVLAWVQAQGPAIQADRNRIIVMGDSAGGNLSAVLARKHRRELCAQVLIYPVLDGTLSGASVSEHARAPLLSRKVMQFFVDCYARTPADLHDPEFSPLVATDLKDLPPCLIITGDYDVLRDDGFAYAARLRAAGNEVRHEHYPDIHGFLSFPALCASANDATAVIAAFVRTALAGQEATA